MKHFFSVLVIVLFIAFMSPISVFADTTEIKELKINPYGREENAIDTVNWYKSEWHYYIFLPADTILKNAKVYFMANDTVYIDGKEILSGDTAVYFSDGTHILSCGENEYTVTVCVSANLPAAYIATESNSLDYVHSNKENKEKGEIRIYQNNELQLEKELKHIKGRGNASWNAPKKSYNIKFDEKTDLFGMGKAKKYTLLANYFDDTLLRNVYGWELSKSLGLHFASDYQLVDLYINGDYLGNYVICESVEISNSRININDLEKSNEKANLGIDLKSLPQVGTGINGTVQGGTVKTSAKWIDIPSSPENITGGYLLEYDYPQRYDAEMCGFVTDNGQPVVIKSPQYASESEVRYIQGLVNDATNALYSNSGYNEKGKHYSDYFDIDSLMNMYILQELSSNIDAGFSSLFLYTEQNSDKLVLSPVWDFDHAFGDQIVRFGVNNGDPNIWWANSLGFYSSYPIYTIFNAAFRHDDFKSTVHNRWKQLIESGIFDKVIAEVHTLSVTATVSGSMNMIRWNKTAASDPDSTVEMYEKKVANGESFILQRCEALSKGFSENVSMLYYNANGGTGNLINPTIALVGDSVTVIEYNQGKDSIRLPGDEYLFAGWNTMADGSGEVYHPGESIILTDADITLYAIWEREATDEFEPATVPLIKSETITPTIQPEKTKTPTTNATISKPEDWIASLEDYERMALCDFKSKNDTSDIYTTAITVGQNQLEIRINDNTDKLLDVYKIDACTGIGTDQNGNTVNLPETGITSRENIVVAGSAVALVLAGLIFIVASFKKRKVKLFCIEGEMKDISKG